jgi:pimeloyl-ACP methyl ester carboxylesterase
MSFLISDRRAILTFPFVIWAFSFGAGHIGSASIILRFEHEVSHDEEKSMFKHEYANVNNIRLHYVSAGKGKLLLFLHGFPEFWYEWKHQLAEFGRDYQAVALDMRGYNLSSRLADVKQYGMKYLVEDVRAFAAHLGHRKFVLVGHDWGGGVAWPFAMCYPDYLEKLIIINAPHPITFMRELRDNPAQREASQYIQVYRTPEAEEILSRDNYKLLVDAFLRDGLKQGYFTEEDCKAYIEAWSQPGALTGGLNYYRSAHLGPFTGESDEALSSDPSLFAVKVPTLVIWGEKDRYLLTGNLEGLDKYVPNLTVKCISEGSHWVIHEQPALINTYIREFINDRS